MKLRSYPGRIFAVLAVTAALTLAPSTAFADDITGTAGDDDITGTVGDDTIDGQGGDDRIAGDGDFVDAGGDDVIDGGDGDDRIFGDGAYVGDGGDDVISGGAGNDTIHGDAVFVAFGGDDELDGDAGDDLLYGDGGNDLLCGGVGEDVLFGGGGIDIGCAVDDETTLDAGVPGVLDLTLNDDFLDDEGDGTSNGVDEDEASLRYRLVSSSPGIVGAAIDEITGILTFTANASGTVEYEVYRAFNDVEIDEVRAFAVGDIIASLATVFITVPVEHEPVTPDEPSTPAPEEAALLPNTGAGDSLMQGGAALALILGGIGLLMAGRRRSDRESREVQLV